MIRVVLADDEALVRSGLRVLIEREAELELVGEAADGDSALDVVRRTRPDVVLLDIRMPGMDGLETLRAIVADPDLREAKVVIVTTFGRDRYVFEALRAGAAGFVLKDAEPAELMRAVHVAAAGDALLSPAATRHVVDLFARSAPGGAPPLGPDPDMSVLTAREREVVAWVATGRSNDEIAAELSVSADTIRTHVGRGMLKLGARDRAQLVVFAVRAGLTLPG